MPLSPRQQADIMASDAVRRAERYLLENARLGIDVTDTASDAYKIAHAPKDSHVNPCLVKGVGMVSPPVKPTASQNCWDRGMKGHTRGVAPGSKDPTPSVAITKDGVTTVVPVSQLRATRNRASAKTSTVKIAETAQHQIVGGHNFND